MLSDLSRSGAPSQGTTSQQSIFLPNGPSPTLNQNIHPELQTYEPGPNSHPNGPPALGGNPSPQDDHDSEIPNDQQDAVSPTNEQSPAGTAARGRRGGTAMGHASPGSAEWQRLRKDNHVRTSRIILNHDTNNRRHRIYPFLERS